MDWLLRKLFPKWLKKPAPDKERAKTGRAKTRSARSLSKGALAERTNAITADADGSATVAIPRDEIRKDAAPAVAPAPTPQASQQGDAAETKVHIFNFRAWFMADPVKAALTLGLAFLSWLATYTGMLELIQANAGVVDIGTRIAIGFAVMMLMLMILYLLDSLYAGGTPTWLKPVFVFGYLFLTLISVGFGFGFYWKYLEAQTEATRSAESAVSQVQVSLQIGQTRLEQLQSTFTQLTTLSTTKATQERDHGNSCPNSSPGEGPRMRLRDSDSQKFGYAAEYITGRADTVKLDLNALNGDLKKVVSRDPSTVGPDGTRNKFLRALGRKLDLTIARFNTLRTDPQLRQFRDSFDKRASTTQFPNGRGGSFRCPDVQLQTALRGVVRAIDDIPEIKNPKIAAVEGSEAIIEAFRRLAVTLAALPTLKLPPSPDELRKARKQAISAGKNVVEVSNIDAGLSKRDYIPLSAAVFVDLCILLISLNRSYDHMGRFQTSVTKARASEFGGTMLDIFEAHKNKISQEMLEIFHHAEFEHGRDYYLAVPLVKGSQKALMSERLDKNIEEGYRSERDDIDRDIKRLRNDLDKFAHHRVTYEELIRRKEMPDHLLVCQNHNQLLDHKKQLQLTYKDDTPEQFLGREGVAEIHGGLQKTNEYFRKLKLQEDKLIEPFQRMELIETKIDQLKKQRTENLKLERGEIRGQLSTTQTHDIAREARFLSNLCISLEANGILHLASIWPFQRTVRAQLKRHDSRYYAEDRHYRVYRFRKVADTQSQMVLDLIMEAVKRSEENGELNDNNKQEAEQAEIAAAAEKARLEDQERHRQQQSEIEKLAHAQKLQTLEEENREERQQDRERIDRLEKDLAAKEEATKQAESPIDRTATDVEYTDERFTKEFNGIRNAGKQSPEAAKRANRALRSFEGMAGLGVPAQELSDLVEKNLSVKVDKSARVETFTIVDDQKSKVAEKTTGMVKKMFGGFLSRTKGLADEVAQKPEVSSTPEAPSKTVSLDLEEDLRDPIEIEPRSVSKSKPEEAKKAEPEKSEAVQPEFEEATHELAFPEAAFEPLVAHADVETSLESSSREAEPQRHVNEDSLLPERLEISDETPVEEPAAAKLDEPEVSEELPRLTELKSSLAARVQNLNDGEDGQTGLADKITPVEADRVVETKPLSDPVTSDSVNAIDQDVQTSKMPPLTATRDTSTYEPSEVDNTEFGSLPKSFAPKSASFDEASEKHSIQSMAERFRPTTKEK